MAGNAKRYEPVSSKVDFPQLETSVLEAWREADLFHQVDRIRADAPLFVFYEGPPTANGSPGIHHVLSRSFKDVILRYKTMRGYRPLRRGGWDTHGLPVELEIEKELGISSKQEIEEFGIEEFNRRCRESVFRYVGEWEAMTERAGVWLDMADAYVTYNNSYIESVWWVFKRLWDKGLVYEGYKVTPHCPRCVTSLSSHEVALGYQEDTPDPSIYVRFPASNVQTKHGARGFDLPVKEVMPASAMRVLAEMGYNGRALDRAPPRLHRLDDDALDAHCERRSHCRAGRGVRPVGEQRRRARHRRLGPGRRASSATVGARSPAAPARTSSASSTTRRTATSSRSAATLTACCLPAMYRPPTAPASCTAPSLTARRTPSSAKRTALRPSTRSTSEAWSRTASPAAGRS